MKANNNILFFRKFGILFLVMATFTAMVGHNSLGALQSAAVIRTVDIENDEGLERESEKDGTEVGVPAYLAIVPMAQLNLAHELYFIADLNLLHEIETEEIIEMPSYFNAYHKTLFRLIISPNAP